MVDRLNRCLQVVPTQLARLLINDFFFKQKDLRACHRALQKKKVGRGGLEEEICLDRCCMHQSTTNILVLFVG